VSGDRDLIQRLIDELHLAGAELQFGLRNQGHIPTVERMLGEGQSWDAIGRAIGWDPAAAREWYEWDREHHP
jgi:hypothetical protein